MSRILIFIAAVLLLNCRTPEWYFQKAYNKLPQTISGTDSLIFPFRGKSALGQYWDGRLIAFRHEGELVIREFGNWAQYNPDDPEEIWTTATFDTSGSGLIISSEVYNSETGGFHNQVICKDTIISSIGIRKCDYRWYHDSGGIEKIYSLITYGNPGVDGKFYGKEVEYDKSGSIKSIKYHQPEISKSQGN
jgi:hypothetical protein